MKQESGSLQDRLRRVKAVVMDVDGVLTDGGMYYGPDGEVMRKFHTKDGMGIRLLLESGIRVAWITGERSEIALRRAEKLKVEEVFLGVEEKEEVLRGYLAKHDLSPEEVAYVGDDVNDLSCLRLAGAAIVPADASDAVRSAAHWVTDRRGGEGAVREVADAILLQR